MVEKISSDMLVKEMEQLQQGLNETNKTPESNTKIAGDDFKDTLSKLIDDVDVAQKEADESLTKLATGKTSSIQDVVLKMEEADVSFKLMKEIRDKLLSAYKEVMGMSS